jgi:hypothetical protein
MHCSLREVGSIFREEECDKEHNQRLDTGKGGGGGEDISIVDIKCLCNVSKFKLWYEYAITTTKRVNKNAGGEYILYTLLTQVILVVNFN